MGRAFVWGLALLCAAGLAWFLLADEGPAVPGYGPLLEDEAAALEATSGPGLKGRDGAPLLDDRPLRGQGRIHGMVLDEDGHPLAGLRISAAPRANGNLAGRAANRSAALRVFQAPRRPGRSAASARSGADGRFVIEGVDEGTSYYVRADVEAPRLSSGQDWTHRNGSRQWLRLVVATGSPFRGRVVDADGRGVAAWVTANAWSALGNKPWLRLSWRPPAFETKADGRFTLAAAPHGTVIFAVLVPGRGERSNIRIDTPAKGEVDLPFEDASGATLTGRVTDTSGGAIAGAKVSVASAPEQGSGDAAQTSRAVQTAEDGTFRVERLVPGTLRGVNVFAEGYVPAAALGNGMALPADRPTQLEIVLARGVTIEGRVIDGRGAPVAGADVFATRMGQEQGAWFAQLGRASSAADGSFTLADVALGPGLVQARAEGFYLPQGDAAVANPWPWMTNAMRGVPYEATAEGQRIAGKEVKLLAGPPLEGRVEDETGAPVPGAVVTLVAVNQGWAPGWSNRGSPTAVTDAGGLFRFPGSEPEKVYKLSARTATQLSEEVQVTVPAEGPPKETPTLVLKTGGAISGRVIEADGSGAAGVQVACSGTALKGLTDGDGAYHFEGLKAGALNVSVEGINPVPESARKAVTVEWGKALEGIDLRMPRLYTIRGVVVDEVGKSLAAIPVTARRASAVRPAERSRSRGRRRRQNYYATTNAEGRFELGGLPEGSFRVSAGTGSEDGVSAGAEDVRLTFGTTGRVVVEGRVLGPQGGPVARGTVRIWTGKDGKRNSNTQAPITGGIFRTRVVTQESAVDVEVTAASDPAGRPLNFLSEREKDISLSGSIEIRLEEGLEVSGSVVDSSGAPMDGMQVRLSKKGQRNYNYWWGGGSLTARSHADGTWTVVGLQQGDYTVSLTPGGAWVTPDPIEVRAGETDVVLRLHRGLTVAGRVTDAEGAPLASANVWMAETAASKASRGAAKRGNDWMSSMRLRTKTGADGHFELKGLPEDTLFDVSAAGSGTEQPFISETLEDVAAGTTTVELRLRRGVLITGEVVGPEGEAITSGYVRANPLDRTKGIQGGMGQLNGSSNKFTIGPLLPGRYRLVAQLQGRTHAAPPPLDVDAPSAGIRLVAMATASIRGRLDGDDVGGFGVSFQGSNSSQSATTARDGSFTIAKTRSAVGTLYAHKRGDDRYGLLENVVPGKGPYSIGLLVGDTIEGRIDGWSGGGRTPSVYCQVRGVWKQGAVASDGSFRIGGLPPGAYMVTGVVKGGSVGAQANVSSGSTDVVLKYTPKASR